jgi:hypothetical protein
MVDQQRRSAAVDAAWYAMPMIWTSTPAVLFCWYAAWLDAQVAAALPADEMISCVTMSGRRASNSASTMTSRSAMGTPRAPPSPATARPSTKSPRLRSTGNAPDT